MKDRSDDPSHHERTLLPRSYISLLLAGTRNSLMGSPWRIDPTTHRTMSERSYHGAISRSHRNEIKRNGFTMEDRSDDPSLPTGMKQSAMGSPWRIDPTTHRSPQEWKQSAMGSPWRIDPTTHRTMSERSYHGATSRSHRNETKRNGFTMEDRSDDPSLPQE